MYMLQVVRAPLRRRAQIDALGCCEGERTPTCTPKLGATGEARGPPSSDARARREAPGTTGATCVCDVVSRV